MTANKFTQEIVTPLLSLEYWANRVPEKIRDEIFRGIPNNSRLYEWDRAKFEIAGNFPQITIPIGKVVEDGDELNILIYTSKDGKIYTAINSSAYWFNLTDTKVLYNGVDENITLKSCGDNDEEDVEIDETLSYNASEYIISLVFAFIENTNTINKNKKKDLAAALCKIISLKDQINENNPADIMSETNINRIKGIFDRNNMSGGDVNIFGSTIDILLKPKYNSPYTYKDIYLSLYLNTDTSKCVAMIDYPIICEVEKAELSPMFNDARITTIRVNRTGTSSLDLGINIDDDMYDDIMPQLYKLIECLEILIGEQKEMKENINAVSNKSFDKKESFRYICGLFLSLKDYINIHDSEDNDVLENIKDIINDDESMSGLLRLDDDSYLLTVLKYSAPLEFLSKLSIERGINGDYDIYIHHEPIGATKITEIPLVSDTNEGLLIAMDRYNSMDLRISEANLKLLESDLIKVIDKLNNM